MLTRKAGRLLLRRVIAGYPEDWEARVACEQLGDNLGTEGRLEDAEHALRASRSLGPSTFADRSSLMGTLELRLAEILLATGDPTRLDEVDELLMAYMPELQQRNFLRNHVYRYLLASARVARRRGSDTAGPYARQALAVLAEVEPPLPRHPTVGRPHATAQEVAELSDIATVR